MARPSPSLRPTSCHRSQRCRRSSVLSQQGLSCRRLSVLSWRGLVQRLRLLSSVSSFQWAEPARPVERAELARPSPKPPPDKLSSVSAFSKPSHYLLRESRKESEAGVGELSDCHHLVLSFCVVVFGICERCEEYPSSIYSSSPGDMSTDRL